MKMYEPAPQRLQPSAVAMRPGHEEAAAQILDLEAQLQDMMTITAELEDENARLRPA